MSFIFTTAGGQQYRADPLPRLSRPAGMKFGVVLPDYETVWVERDVYGVLRTLKKLDRNSRNEILNGQKQGSGYNAPSGEAVPATARFSDDRPVEMPCDLQWWLFDMNKSKAPSLARAKADWASCFRDNVWMSNNSGTWSRHDCINENGLPDFLQVQPMMTGGAVFRYIGETAKDYLVEAINPKVNDFTHYITPEVSSLAVLHADLVGSQADQRRKGTTLPGTRPGIRSRCTSLARRCACRCLASSRTRVRP
jgi:hypothetical protein